MKRLETSVPKPKPIEIHIDEVGDSKIYSIKLFNFCRYVAIAKYFPKGKRKAVCIFDNPFDAWDFLEEWEMPIF